MPEKKAPKRTPKKAAGPKAKASKPRAAKPAPGLEVAVDYPQEGELVLPGQYTVRLSAGAQAAKVEVSVDGGPWSDCRNAAGHWWFDWSAFPPGAHSIEGRASDGEGLSNRTGPRRFEVSENGPDQ